MTEIDDSPDLETQSDLPELGRKFYWREKELSPLSYNAQATLFRLTPGVALTNFEHDFLLLYLLLQTPRRMDALRTDAQLADFRLECGAWVDRERLDAKYEEVRAICAQIQGEVVATESLSPELPKGETAAPGNA